jgi:hypothetical protein
MYVRTLRLSLVLALSIGLLAFALVPARADGGGGSFFPPDKRHNPVVGDRVAVYCNDNSVDVWGLDTSNIGFRLAVFTPAELMSKTKIVRPASEGTITLQFVRDAKTHIGYSKYDEKYPSVIVDQGAQYSVTWMGGHDGADGSKAFQKVFSCTYLPPAFTVQ